MDKCLIVRYRLGSKTWFLVEQNGLTLSTPLDTFADATAWVKNITDCRIGCARITDDCTEVTCTPIDSQGDGRPSKRSIEMGHAHYLTVNKASQSESEWCFDRSTGLMGSKTGGSK